VGQGFARRHPDRIAIDRKTSRRSHDRAKGRKPPHMVSAWAAGQRIVPGRQACEEKSNEITAIPLLLKNLELKNALVTIDAMGTQTKIAQAIRGAGGDYVPALKKNWPGIHAEVELSFKDPPAGTIFEMHRTVDGCNGRIATRPNTMRQDVDWMTSDRHYPGEPKFPGLAMIGRVESEVERDGTIVCETRYDLSSARLSPEMFGWAARAHWAIESVPRRHTERSSP
jgi:hypothetical protein